MVEAGWRLEELVGQSAHAVMEEDPVPQEPEFSEEEAEWAPLPDSEEEEELEAPVAPMETSDIAEPVETVRELDLRSRTIRIPVPATQEVLAAARPEEFQPADLKDLPEQLRMELEVPQVEPYMIAQGEGSKNIVCDLCSRQFETLKGWRIHASRTHKQDGFCSRCGHNLLLPPGFTAAQRTAAVELHALDWCPRACAAIINERQVKRRRLDLVGREEDAHHLFIPGQ
ncbi:Uncharacterized protein BM_BM17623 [Brugia malayi]|uniref:C2H2-type domain-containing protein n=1 Tax=Brugia malayi TaxID=6279 RepID=A0A4E9FHC2_BRUMA|nr:Uncharacterized protein BM_BM17623 [Brugia malayi]VIO95754.1 Uncharacterized protein BM_BM17623 [Brugia malayi]